MSDRKRKHHHDKSNKKHSHRRSYEEFSWERFRSELNKVFFRDNDVIKRGTKVYHNFWQFLNKYSTYEKIKEKSKGEDLKSRNSHEYDKQNRINFSLNYTSTDELMSRLPPVDEGDGIRLSRAKIEEFRSILLHYLDFLQKQKFNKLIKLRKSQENLPIFKYKQRIVDAVKENQVVIVAGDTGCGKSTQVPQYLIGGGFDNISCTQPRRIACTSLCKRVAYETLNEYGSEIGYQIRFERSKTKHTRILFLTEGLLLRQVSTDPTLSSYNVIILDEIHERHLHSDFLLGIMKCLASQRKDLKLVLMSATINIELFANYFGSAPVIQVPGRLFPITLQYFPISTIEQTTRSGRLNPAPYIRILNLIDKKYPENEHGDVLIFLSGITEITTVLEAAQMHAQVTKKWVILPLHSTLSVAEQDKVFDFPPPGVRKCIVSTNIAETSVTIDGVRFVVDSGKVKEMSFDDTCRMQRLQEFWISKASAEQRKGRAGRTGPGVCFRLYSQAEYDALCDYSVPEIQRVPFDSLIVQMISMGLNDVRKFPFIESPPMDSIEHSIQHLKEQQVVTTDEKLTGIGQLLAKLPVDVLTGKMLIMGTMFHLMEPILSLAAGLSVQSPITNKGQRDPDAVALRQSLESIHGDAFTLLNLYNEWLNVKSDGGDSRKWCKHRGLEEQRFYDMTKLRQQFKQLLQDAGLIDLFANTAKLTSTERALRHGEIKRLREMKRDYHHKPKLRKILKVDEDNVTFDDDDDEKEKSHDIKHIDFHLSFNKNEIQMLSKASQALKHQDVVLLKMVLCSGLYPQVALADQHNSYKSEADHVFHTKSKPYVVLHPLSVFSTHPEQLQISELDRVTIPGFDSKHPLSNAHQLLLYMSLLETTKPYLMNVTRVPAIHILLLFSSNIDTNHDFSRLVFDEWLDVRFPNSDDGSDLVMQAMNLRNLWCNILEDKIEGKSERRKNVEEGDLARQLVNFVHVEANYTLSRLLAADLQDLYVGPAAQLEDVDEKQKIPTSFLFNKDVKPDIVKGGLKINHYLTFGCLQEWNMKSSSFLRTHWTCPICECELVLTALERIEHQTECGLEVEKNKSENEVNPGEAGANSSSSNGFFCQVCNKILLLTPTEILRHKKSHQT